jgi:hypothetical protein
MEWCKQRGAISGRGSNPNRARKGGKGKRRGESGRKEASNNPLPRGLPPSLARSLAADWEHETRRGPLLPLLSLSLSPSPSLSLSVRSVILLLLLPLQINDQTKKAARPNNKLVLGLLVGFPFYVFRDFPPVNKKNSKSPASYMKIIHVAMLYSFIRPFILS